jgi:hypothetical protein
MSSVLISDIYSGSLLIQDSVSLDLMNQSNVLSVGVSGHGNLSGVVLYPGSAPAALAKVFAFNRKTGAIAGAVFADEDGSFNMSGVAITSDGVLVVAIDPDGGTSYNAVVFDKVLPE